MTELNDIVHNTMDDEQYDTEWETIVQTMPNGAKIPHPDGYKGEEHDALAFEAMSGDNGSMSAVCVALQCSKPTLLRWIPRHKNLAAAVQKGKAIGEEKFRKKIADHAFQPTSEVNNGLIKMLAKNVHGIDADEAPTVIINNTNDNSTTVVDSEETANLYKEALEGKNGKA